MGATFAHRLVAPDFLQGRRAYYGAYSVCFAVFCIACFAYLYATGHCLIWEDDGVDQHFTFFCYFGTWMREALSTGMLPQWDFSLGYGSDIICTLASWIGEPFNLLSIACPEQYSEYLYQALVIVRLYLVGLAFSAYCRYHKCEGYATLLGALAYTFSGFCLIWGAFRHTMFLDPAFLLPWVLLGADKVFDGKRPTTLLVALCVMFITYFYFAYMIAIFLVMYCVLRYFTDDRDRSVRDFLVLVGRFALYALVGVLVAGVLLAPIVAYVMQMGRLSADHPVALFRTLGVYVLYPITFAGGDSSTRGLPMESLAVFGVAALFFAAQCRKDKKLRPVRIALGVLFVFTIFPVFGKVLNGFSYSSDRWMFAFAMAVAYAIVLVVPRIRDFDRRDWRAVGIVVGVFVVCILALLVVWYNRVWGAIAIACLVGTYLVLRACCQRGSVVGLRVALMAFLLVGTAQFSTMHLATTSAADDKTPHVATMARFGHVLEEMTTQSPARLLEGLDDSSQPHRFDKATELHRRNSTAMLGLYSVDLYASVYSQTVDDFRIALAIPQNTDLQSHHTYTSDSRAAVEALTSVKYFLATEKEKPLKPYGFDDLARADAMNGTDYNVWQTGNDLPFAFTYDAVVPADYYQDADPLRRQQALLQGCAVEGSSLPTTQVNDTAVEVPFTVNEAESDSVTLGDDGSITCTKRGGRLVLEFDGVPNAETYVYLDNMHFDRFLPSELLSQGELAALSLPDRLKLLVEDQSMTEAADYEIAFKNGKASKAERFTTTLGGFYTGKHTWLVNTGYTKDACKKLTLTFSETGVITMDNFKVLCQPMDDLAAQVAARAADPVEVQLGTNSITGTVDAPGKRLVYLSVPYSEGWSATVDGHEAKVLKANSGFMAIEVGEGRHDFAFAYQTPYLAQGAILSLIGLALFAAVILFNRKRNERA